MVVTIRSFRFVLSPNLEALMAQTRSIENFVIPDTVFRVLCVCVSDTKVRCDHIIERTTLFSILLQITNDAQKLNACNYAFASIVGLGLVTHHIISECVADRRRYRY